MSLRRSLAPSAPILQEMLSTFHGLNWVLQYLDSLLSISENKPKRFYILACFQIAKGISYRGH